jgi:hypothetical protein
VRGRSFYGKEIRPLAARFLYYVRVVFDRPSRMIKPPSFLKIFERNGPLVVLGVTIALLVGVIVPASAQFFNFGGQPRQSHGFGWFGSDFFSPFQPQAPK